MNELALFAGAGGGILGGKLLGWRTVCAVEINSYAASVLVSRQNDGLLPPFPIWDDVCTFDGKPWRGIVDVVSGGFPCQDISAAGKGAGITGERSGLWNQFKRIICEVRPRFAFVENSPVLTSRGIDVVLGDLASLGYDAEWGVLGAADVGAPHQRDRIWIVSYSKEQHWIRLQQKAFKPFWICEDVADSFGNGREAGRENDEKHDRAIFDPESEQFPYSMCQGSPQSEQKQEYAGSASKRDWWATEPDVGRVVNGLAARVDRLTALGNGQVPHCAAMAWKILTERINRWI